MGLFKNHLRLRMNMTHQNASPELLDACRKFVYPEFDIPETTGLLRCFTEACHKSNLQYQLLSGPRELQSGGVAYFEPYKFRLPFQKIELHMTIAPGEFQWIMKNVKNEPPHLQMVLETFKLELLNATRDWVVKGNR